MYNITIDKSKEISNCFKKYFTNAALSTCN